MTITAPINTINRSERSASSKTSPQGFDRALESLGIALVKWSRSRTARTIVSPDEYVRLIDVERLHERRESDALHLTQRIGL